ncbi:MAG TPA: hypothetical protein VGM30_09360 [Puia sp.]|jgi:hypothetical protein
MKLTSTYVFFGTLFFFIVAAGHAQTIIYSQPEKRDFDKFKFDVIAKHRNILLVYKAVYFSNPYHTAPRPPAQIVTTLEQLPIRGRRRVSAPQNEFVNNSVLESAICFYDTTMRLLDEKVLPLPKQITGVNFLVYEDFFYLYYQYRDGRTIYCMAAKIGMDGTMIDKPIEMDRTTVTGIYYQDEIYSVIYSEDKQHILALNLNIYNLPNSVLHTILFDRELRALRRLNNILSMPASEYLSEFQLDNTGSLLFVGLSDETHTKDGLQGALFTLPANEDSIAFSYIVPSSICVDDLRLLIDNRHRRVILASFYSSRMRAPIEGLYMMVRDADGRRRDRFSRAIFADSLRRVISGKASDRKTVFDDYYLQDLHLAQDGSFTIETQQLVLTPDLSPYNRWDYLPLYGVGSLEFARYNPYEHDHYYPWNQWHYLHDDFGFTSRGALIARMDTAGIAEWVNSINMKQVEWAHSTVGYKSIIANRLLYFLYNIRIRQRTYLTAQSIDSDGGINTDDRLKEDLALRDSHSDYFYYPRMAKLVDNGELILPCRRGHLIYLAKVDF